MKLRPHDKYLPLGIPDLEPEVNCDPGPPKRVQCYVHRCEHILRTPRRGYGGETCPAHSIRCHYSSAGATYSYADVRRNIIASPDQFASRVLHHPFKYESHRMGSENSEDAVSWNVFKSLQDAGNLSAVAKRMTGEDYDEEPNLYLWGIGVSDGRYEPWDLLVQARDRFEPNLPVKRPLTEPDIALHLPGRYLILIEAKFTSPNTCYSRGPRKNATSLTFDELLSIYWDESLEILDIYDARDADRIWYQLWRNMVFAEWMAKAESRKTQAYHVNLVRKEYDDDSFGEFYRLVRPEYEGRFQAVTWETIYDKCLRGPRLERLRSYFETKTAGLQPAFRLD